MYSDKAEELFNNAEKDGFIITLNNTIEKNFRALMPFSSKAKSESIDVLELSVRSENALKRAQIFTIGMLIEAIVRGPLTQIRNLGSKSNKEIKTKLLLWNYSRMTDAERKQFWKDMLEANSKNNIITNK